METNNITEDRDQKYLGPGTRAATVWIEGRGWVAKPLADSGADSEGVK